MMKTADTRQGLDFARPVRASLNPPPCRRCLLQPDVGSVGVIVGQILAPQPAQMLLIEGNDVVECLAANISDPTLRDSVLPRAPNTRTNRLDAAGLEKLAYIATNLASRSNRTYR